MEIGGGGGGVSSTSCDTYENSQSLVCHCGRTIAGKPGSTKENLFSCSLSCRVDSGLFCSLGGGEESGQVGGPWLELMSSTLAASWSSKLQSAQSQVAACNHRPS